MSATLGIAVVMIGMLLTVVGVVGANVVAFRSLPLMTNNQAMRPNRAAIFTSLSWLIAWAAFVMFGITLMLIGFVLSGNVVTWAPILPLALVMLMIPLAWYLRSQANEARNS